MATSTDLDLFSLDPGQSWEVSMIQSTIQAIIKPLQTTQVVLKHVLKHPYVYLKQRQLHVFVRIQNSETKSA